MEVRYYAHLHEGADFKKLKERMGSLGARTIKLFVCPSFSLIRFAASERIKRKIGKLAGVREISEDRLIRPGEARTR